MADIPYYDLLNEVDCSDRCEAVIALCELVDKLIADIQFLELECISTRYLLSQYMDKEEGHTLQAGIQENQPTNSTRASCTAVGILWNSAIILSRCKKPARVTGPAGIEYVVTISLTDRVCSYLLPGGVAATLICTP